MTDVPSEPGPSDAVGAPDAVESSRAGDAPDIVEERSRFALMRDRLMRSEAQVEAKYDELKGRRGESTPIDVAFRVIEADRRVAGGLISGGMAFRIFVVMVPFAFVLVTLMGLFGEAVDPSDPVGLAKDAGMTGLVATAVSYSADASTAERLLTLTFAGYALLWGTWTLIRAMRAVHGLAWELDELPRISRPWRPTLLGVAGVFGAWFAGVGASRLSDLIDPLAEIVVRLLFLGVIIGVWIALSSVLPRASGTTWRALIPGALLFGVGVEVLQFLTVYFFSHYIASKTNTYGAIGASIAILLWAYLLGRIVVTSAFLNAERWRQSEEQRIAATG